jgi:hypothetical protein
MLFLCRKQLVSGAPVETDGKATLIVSNDVGAKRPRHFTAGITRVLPPLILDAAHRGYFSLATNRCAK